MAKLTGVKVVNENMVEYNGFVYELVTDGAKDTDLIQCFEDGYDNLTYEVFYEVIRIDAWDDMSFLDDANDKRDRDYKDEEWKVFRKSHAITNDEGVVTITLPDGTKLEGTPSDLAAVTRSMQKMQEEQVVSVEVPEEVVDVEVEIEPVSERLQVGEYAKVIQQGHTNFGHITKITNDNRDSHLYPYATELLNGKSGDVHSEDHLVKATDEEVLEAKQALLKEGDFARVIANTTCHSFEIGTIVKLDDYAEEKDAFTAYYIDGSDFWRIYRSDLEPLTKEETEHITREAEEEKKAKAEREEKEAERAKWTAIGREVGEIKKGDIVRTVSHCGSVNPVGTIGVAREDSTVDSCSTVALNGDTGNWSSVELIVPVEQRFDTVG